MDMDAAALGHAVELLGRFNDDMTAVVDAVFGTQWAEIEEMIAIVVLVGESPVTTRRLSQISGLDRRAVSRLIARMGEEGSVRTRRSERDGRAREVVLTARGRTKARALRTAAEEFLRASAPIAREISDGVGPPEVPAAPAPSGDAIELLQRLCQAGAALVRFMPGEARRGMLAARQRAALVQIVGRSPVRPSDLSPSLDVSRAGAAYIVDQLCAKGYVVRRRGAVAEDRRAVVLEATPAGVQAVLSVMAGIERQRSSLAILFAEVAGWARPATPLAAALPVRADDPSTPHA
jgi:DNA-binding MarR family transcriptional regulator